MDRTGRAAESIVDLFLMVAAALTAAYLLVFLAWLPAVAFYPAAVAAVAAVLYACRGRWRSLRRDAGGGWGWPGPALLGICLLSASINLFWGRPDADDFSFFHRALVQLDHLREPFFRHDTAHELPRLPPISPFHLTAALEPGVALLARAAGIPVLQALQTGVGVVALFLLPLVYFPLFRFHRFSAPLSVVGTVFVLGFLAVSGDTHRDWGNFTLMRAWQGKCILVAVLLPALYLYLGRFLVAGRRADLLRLNAVCLIGVGFSGSALFLLPFACSLILGGFLLGGRMGRRHLRRLLLGATPLVYPLLFAGLVKAGMLPSVKDTFVWSTGWPDTPVAVLSAVYPTLKSAGFAAGLVLVAGLLAPRRRLGLTVVGAALLGTTLMLLPVTFKFLISVVKAGAMWRLAYAVPLPLAAGMAGAGAIRLALSVRGLHVRWATLALIAVVAVGAVAIKTPALDRRWLTSPGSLKFHPDFLRISRSILGIVRSPAVVLAPQDVIVVLGLLEPRMKFTAARQAETVHIFRNAGRRDEGELRAAVQQWLRRRNRGLAGAGGLIELLRGRVDAVVAIDSGAAENSRLLSVLNRASPGSGGWAMYDLAGMILFSRRDSRPAGEGELPFGSG